MTFDITIYNIITYDVTTYDMTYIVLTYEEDQKIEDFLISKPVPISSLHNHSFACFLTMWVDSYG